MDSKYKEVLDVIARLNTCWTTGVDIGALSDFFHKDAVALVTSEKKRIRGRDACIAHWKVCSENTIYFWETTSHVVHLYEDNLFATLSYDFKISLEENQNRLDVQGSDLFSLVFEDGRWLIVAATV